jgi:hypothetical protein
MNEGAEFNPPAPEKKKKSLALLLEKDVPDKLWEVIVAIKSLMEWSQTVLFLWKWSVKSSCFDVYEFTHVSIGHLTLDFVSCLIQNLKNS